MPAKPAPTTVFFDGACPLCRAEIAHYRRVDHARALRFVDVAAGDAALPSGLTRRQAMGRFHVQPANGPLLSGAAAFVALWAELPRWRIAARLARLPGAIAILEAAYRVFLPARPTLARWFSRVQRLHRSAR